MSRKATFAGMKPRPRILVREPHPQSPAALIKINRQYRSKREFSCNRPEWRKWLTFRKWYLKGQRKLGPLTCHFCGQTPLQTNTKMVPERDQATIDHLMPRAKGGREYDVDNLVVCCRKCNAKKADKVL